MAAARKQAKGNKTEKVGDHIFEAFPVQNSNAAGIDIASRTHYVSVPEDRDDRPVRKFDCYTPDLQAMATWLKECRITSVVMESTGVYWVPAYDVLTAAGFDVHLVDAYHSRNVPGRKTDVWDARWLRKLHTYGLLSSCFIPDAASLELRTYWRHRATLVEGASQHILRIQKALEQMNVQLHKVVSDVTGVTGMKILRAIVAGERDPRVLAAMRNNSIKASEAEIEKALTGHYRKEHLFTLKQALESYDFIHRQMEECDEQLRQAMSQAEGVKSDAPSSGPAVKPKCLSRRKNEPYFDVQPELTRIFGVDLLKIEGISTMTAMTILAECGPDLSRFKTGGHLASWLGLSPNNQITGGKIRKRRTRPGKSRLATALRIAAQSLHHSKSAMGAYYRRMRARLGAPKAITATAHRLARIIHMMLTQGEEYVAQGQAAYEHKCTERQVAALKRQAEHLGFTLIMPATGEIVS